MAESRIKPENYITVQGWMVTELGLSGKALLLYALLYGFSQDGKSGYSGKQDYLMEWPDCSRSALNNYLKGFKERGLLREMVTETGQKVLQAVRPVKCPKNGHDVQKMDTECTNFGHEDVQKMDTECTNFGHLPIYNNTNNTIYNDSGSRETTPTPPTVEEVAEYCRERGNGIDPQRFHDFYSLRKWRGKDGSIAGTEEWQRIVRLWESNGIDDKKKDKQTSFYGGNFDEDDFFEAAVRSSYGEDYDTYFQRKDNKNA